MTDEFIADLNVAAELDVALVAMLLRLRNIYFLTVLAAVRIFLISVAFASELVFVIVCRISLRSHVYSHPGKGFPQGEGQFFFDFLTFYTKGVREGGPNPNPKTETQKRRHKK